MQKRGSTLTSSKFARKRRTRMRFFILLCVLAAVLLFWGIISLAEMRALSISTIDVQGNQATLTGDIQALVSRDLAPDYLWFFPASDTFLYPRRKIAADILAAWPRISSVEITREGFTGLLVTVTEKQPVALWCGTEAAGIASQSTGMFTSPCYLMDKTGFIFAQEPMAVSSTSSTSTSVFPASVADGSASANTNTNAVSGTDSGFIQFYGPLSNASSTNPIGLSYLTPSEIATINHFIGTLQSGQNIQPQIVIAAGDQEAGQEAGQQDVSGSQSGDQLQSGNSDQSLDLGDCELILAGGSRIFFNDQDDPSQVSANLQLFLSNNNLVFVNNANPVISSTATTTDLIDYIDLRYGTNIYYKTLAPASVESK